MTGHKGFAGKLAETFVNSKLTPVIAVMSIVLGILAVWLTPKEEEPQISVPMIDIQVAAPGFEADDVERKVTEPIERAVWGLDGVDWRAGLWPRNRSPKIPTSRKACCSRRSG